MRFSFRICATALVLFGLCAAPVAAEIAGSPGTPPAAASADPDDPTAMSPPEELELKPRTVVFASGKGKWDDSEDMFNSAFKAIYLAIARQNLHSAGPPMVEYLESDDSHFSFKAMVPVDQPSEAAAGPDLGPDVQMGEGPTGKVLKFVHRGSFDTLEQVYNRIDDYLASKDLTMARVVEEYVTDQRLTPDNEMVTNIYVFTK